MSGFLPSGASCGIPSCCWNYCFSLPTGDGSISRKCHCALTLPRLTIITPWAVSPNPHSEKGRLWDWARARADSLQTWNCRSVSATDDGVTGFLSFPLVDWVARAKVWLLLKESYSKKTNCRWSVPVAFFWLFLVLDKLSQFLKSWSQGLLALLGRPSSLW